MNDFLPVLAGVVLLLGLVGLGLLVLLRRRVADRSEYRAVPLLSPAETTFYRCLLELYGTAAIICPKVRLVDLVRPRQGLDRSAFQTAFNRVSRKHVDFVVLHMDDFIVLGVIELDDSSHERQDRADRDDFVDDALNQAGIRVCRVKVRRQYDPQVLSEQLNSAFATDVSEPTGA